MVRGALAKHLRHAGMDRSHEHSNDYLPGAAVAEWGCWTDAPAASDTEQLSTVQRRAAVHLDHADFQHAGQFTDDATR